LVIPVILLFSLTLFLNSKHEQDLFGDAMSRYKEFVRRKAREYWDEMVRTGSLDAVDATGASSRTPQTGTLHETFGSLAAFPFFMLAAE
jgi:hypothetical protein